MGVLSFALILHLATLPLLHGRSFEFHSKEALVPRKTFDKFVVEVHAIADKSYHEYFDSEKDLAHYIAVLLNGVNVYYSNFSNPRISFKLVGVTRKKEDDLPKTAQGEVIGNWCFGYIKRFHEQANLSYKPDVVLLLTSKSLVSLQKGNITGPIGGMATRPSTCRKGAAVAADNPGSFSGVRYVAHELAHTLGAPDCDRKGYGVDIPMCKKKVIENYASTLKDYCIRETAAPLFKEYPRDLPGEAITEEEYCKKRLGKIAYGSAITIKRCFYLFGGQRGRTCERSGTTFAHCRQRHGGRLSPLNGQVPRRSAVRLRHVQQP
ncbi:venom metalloproteinase antarease-like TpachMP_B isoform X1 [Haemaphysalis longicornis]